MPTKHTFMREDISTVNSRQFSAERTDTTLHMALDAIGTDFAELLAADEEDGVWTLAADVTIPGNVVLRVPLGVTFTGPGNLIILGGLWAMRWPFHLGPGTVIQDDSVLGLTTSKMTIKSGEFDDLYIKNRLEVGGYVAVGPNPPAQSPFGTDFIYRHWINDVQTLSMSPTLVNRQSLAMYQSATMTGDSNNRLYGIHSVCSLDLGGFTLTYAPGGAGVAALNGQTVIRGTGGVVDRAIGVGSAVYNLGTGVVTEGICLLAEVPAASTGVFTSYYGLYVRDFPYAVGAGAFGVWSNMSSITNHYNLYMAGSAPNFMQAALAINTASHTTAHKLEVNGTAGTPGGAWVNTTSSLQLKRNIQPLSGALARLLQLQGRSWEWDLDAVEGRAVPPGPQVGLVLEEVAQVMPQWAITLEDGTQGLWEVGSLGLLIEALRELHTRLEAVEGK